MEQTRSSYNESIETNKILDDNNIDYVFEVLIRVMELSRKFKIILFTKNIC